MPSALFDCWVAEPPSPGSPALRCGIASPTNLCAKDCSPRWGGPRTDSAGWWASLGTAYDWGGESRVDGVAKGDYRETFLYGMSDGAAIDRQSSVQIAYAANRARKAIGSDRDSFAFGYSIWF